MLCVIDEFTRECLAIRMERRPNSRDVLDTLGELFLEQGLRQQQSGGEVDFVTASVPDVLVSILI